MPLVKNQPKRSSNQAWKRSRPRSTEFAKEAIVAGCELHNSDPMPIRMRWGTWIRERLTEQGERYQASRTSTNKRVPWGTVKVATRRGPELRRARSSRPVFSTAVLVRPKRLLR